MAKNILICDDAAFMRMMIKDILTKNGYGIAGEPIDVLVNGKFVAKGEVVVIEESFGIRVTEIIK